MIRYVITKSLIESWYYVHDCWEGYEDDAMASFLTTLRGEKEELTPEQQQNIQNGFAFEKLVTDIATGQISDEAAQSEKWYRPAAEFGRILTGAQFQIRLHRPIRVRGIDFDMHGVLDALREGVIYDIKFKNKSFGSLELAGSYLESAQHPFYFYLVPEAKKFQYLVSDGNDVYIEQYTPEESRSAEEIISEFVDFLESAGLMNLYKANWQEGG